ncbi:MAG: M28 family metallopeptidase [Chloroherpetonaceae bacterium]|nr:M28 family metallopeptidase [Chloroherpetonaceae bacterium]
MNSRPHSLSSFLLISILLLTIHTPKIQAQMAPSDSLAAVSYRSLSEKIISHATKDSSAFLRLAELCDRFGHRFSGSQSLEKALDWILTEMKKDGFDLVASDPLKVPRWVRGKESCELLSPRPRTLPMYGLGGSIATPKNGITAEVLVVGSFEELERRKLEAKGKIVLFNIPFTNYGATVITRRNGAISAAKAGAVASLIRSVGPFSIQSPHTGSMSYADSIRKIPHAAISLEDAEMLSRMQARGERIRIRLKMEAKMKDSSFSRNVYAEIKGGEKPEEIVVMGGHSDSWDVGQGAMDDGGGCVAAWNALLTLKQLGLKPKRTIRVVLWTNEENGFCGANDYANRHGKEKHILAIESDGGVFKPVGFGYTGNDAMLSRVRAAAQLLLPLGSGNITLGGGGADIAPLMKLGVPGMGLNVENSKYFWFHHTDGDTMDKLSPKEIAQCVATLAVMAFVVADMP